MSLDSSTYLEQSWKRLPIPEFFPHSYPAPSPSHPAPHPFSEGKRPVFAVAEAPRGRPEEAG